jgi:hypothetical protein
MQETIECLVFDEPLIKIETRFRHEFYCSCGSMCRGWTANRQVHDRIMDEWNTAHESHNPCTRSQWDRLFIALYKERLTAAILKLPIDDPKISSMLKDLRG